MFEKTFEYTFSLLIIIGIIFLLSSCVPDADQEPDADRGLEVINLDSSPSSAL